MITKENRIIILYLDNELPVVISFNKNNILQVKNKVDEIKRSEGKKLLWLVRGNLLNITPDGEIYG